MPPSALNKAMSGEKIPDSKKTGVLNEALDKLKNLGGRLSRAREVSEAVADAAIATAEMQGTVFAASFAEGYWGEDKMDVGPVDMRLGGGFLLGGYGLYQAMSGKGGSHALALGNGLLATGIGRIGRNAGRALVEKNATPPAPAAAAPAPAAPAVKGDDFGAIARMIAGPPAIHTGGDDIGEIARMVRMTPGTEGEDVAGRRSRAPRHGRFLRTRN